MQVQFYTDFLQNTSFLLILDGMSVHNGFKLWTLILFGAFRCGNKPPVQPGDDKKALAKENLRVYNGKCLTTHYQKHEEVLHNEK